MTRIPSPPPAHQRSQARLSFSERSRSREERSVSVSRSRSDSRAPLRKSRSASLSQPAKTSKTVKDLKVSRDVRTRLPACLQRFSGYREPHLQPPYDPIPVVPFVWLRHLSLKHETWLLSTIGSFVGIALVEIVMAAAFPHHDTLLIVASFGASAVLCFSTVESPLAQPRHLVGGQVVSAVIGVGLNRLFRMAKGYQIGDTVGPGELGQLVWVNGALAMCLSLLVMQVTGTTHPPGGATALIAAVQPAAVNMSWRLVSAVVISSFLMLVWALIINNIGRRRYPAYWLSGRIAIVRDPQRGLIRESLDAAEMQAEEGRSRAMELEFLAEEVEGGEGEMKARTEHREFVRGRRFSKPH